MSEWSPEMGASTSRMWTLIEQFDKSKIKLDERLTETERQLQDRIENNIALSRSQAELIDTLIHRIEKQDGIIASLHCYSERHDESLYGTEDENNLGLVVEHRILRRMIQVGRIVFTAVIGLLVFSMQQGWFKVLG